MKTSFLVLALLMMSAVTCGQGESPLCTDRHDETDNNCSTFTNCTEWDHNCEGMQTEFTAGCTGNYYIDAWITDCNVTNPHCKVCVKVKKVSSGLLVGSCVLNVCDEGTTKKTCAAAASLEAGQDYRLIVCLTYCGTPANCDNCQCVGHGCVRYAQTAPCW